MAAVIASTTNEAAPPTTLAVITKAALKQLISDNNTEVQQTQGSQEVQISIKNLKDEVQQNNNIEKIVETVAAAIINGQQNDCTDVIEPKIEDHNGTIDEDEEDDEEEELEEVEFNKNADDNSSFCDESQSIEESGCGQYKQVAIYEEDSPCNDDEKLYKFDLSSSKQDSSSSCSFDAEMMIELIKQHPIIWDSKTKEYNTTAKRLTAWRDVSQQLGIDENICRSKWKNIRDSYKKCINRREIAIRSGARRKKPPFCRFFKELEFLHDVVSIKDSVDSIPNSQSSDHQEENNSNTSKPTQTKTYIVCTDSGEELIAHQIPMELETHSVDDDSKDKQNNSVSEMEQLSNQNHNIVHHVREYSSKLPSIGRSESELFCASLVATFERLDRKKRQLAKIRIQQLLYELEFEDTEVNPTES